jgi:hypothetical protein
MEKIVKSKYKASCTVALILIMAFDALPFALADQPDAANATTSLSVQYLTSLPKA